MDNYFPTREGILNGKSITNNFNIIVVITPTSVHGNGNNWIEIKIRHYGQNSDDLSICYT